MSATDPPPFPPFPLERTERLYDSKWCGLRRDWIRLDEGQLQEYHVFEVPDAVVCVPFTADGRVVMIWQHRHPHGKSHWEAPAGRIGEGEDPLEAARREVLEETGYAAGRMERLPGFYPINGISGHYAHAYRALDCERVAAPAPEAAERLSVMLHERAELEERLRSGRIADGFTALALFYAFAADSEMG